MAAVADGVLQAGMVLTIDYDHYPRGEHRRSDDRQLIVTASGAKLLSEFFHSVQRGIITLCRSVHRGQNS